jgi:hypothetical protein
VESLLLLLLLLLLPLMSPSVIEAPQSLRRLLVLATYAD